MKLSILSYSRTLCTEALAIKAPSDEKPSISSTQSSFQLTWKIHTAFTEAWNERQKTKWTSWKEESATCRGQNLNFWLRTNFLPFGEWRRYYYLTSIWHQNKEHMSNQELECYLTSRCTNCAKSDIQHFLLDMLSSGAGNRCNKSHQAVSCKKCGTQQEQDC